MKHSLIETLEPRTLFAGVTILATGRGGPITSFMQTMANDITTRVGGLVPQFVLTVAPTSSTNGALLPSITQVPGTGTPQTSASGEIILLINYQGISTNPIYHLNYIGSVIADYLMTTPVDGILLASLPIHEIALSRGTGLIDEIAHTLGQSGVWVDEETYLDPDPLSVMNDAPPTIYDNVAFVDDYWRNNGIQSSVGEGQPVDGAYNLNVFWLDSDDAGYANAHDAPTGYYDGTINLTSTFGGDGPIYNSWYGDTPLMPARDATGFIYTDLVGAPRPLSGVWAASGGTGTRTPAGDSGTQWGNVTDLTVTSGDSFASGDSINVSFLHEDRGGADTVTFFLGTTRNPYNDTFAANLGSVNLGQSATPIPNIETLSTTGVAPGSYWLCAQVTNSAGDTRYAYESITSPLTVTPAPVQQLPATLTGNVFNDLTGSGIQNADDPGLPSILVYVDLAGTGQYEASDPSATTDANGNYAITGLTPGTYTVLEVVPAGMRQTTAPPAPVILSNGQTLAVADFGNTQTATISGSVVLKGVAPATAADSPNGFTVVLTQHLKGAGARKFTSTTNAQGGFTFTGLQPYAQDTVQIASRKGYKLAPHTRSEYVVRVTSGGQVTGGLLFSEVPVLPRASRAKTAK